MSALSRNQTEQAWCLVDGHRWQVDRYQDVLTPLGQVVMAGWAHMRCPCGAAERITNPAADWPVQPEADRRRYSDLIAHGERED